MLLFLQDLRLFSSTEAAFFAGASCKRMACYSVLSLKSRLVDFVLSALLRVESIANSSDLVH